MLRIMGAAAMALWILAGLNTVGLIGLGWMVRKCWKELVAVSRGCNQAFLVTDRKFEAVQRSVSVLYKARESDLDVAGRKARNNGKSLRIGGR